MTVVELRRVLSEIPDVEVPASAAELTGIESAVRYLESDAAIESLAEDSYWPKWSSPWWQMLLLVELGEAQRIPQRTVRAMVAALDALPLHVFPIRPEEWPPGLHPSRHASCHCALGNIDRVLAACGVDVDGELPWVLPWFARYQMGDGGLNCDDSAYLVTDEHPSSMVATIACFEVMLRRGPSDFVARGAEFLVARELVLGSASRHNAAEREAARAWTVPAFPRFYFYDVLRGATALARWATQMRHPVPLRAIAPAARELCAISADGIVRVGRRAFDGSPTWRQEPDRTWARAPRAETFPLLDAVSELGAPSRSLTAEWCATRAAIVALIDSGLVTDA
jgi:hypothetical protein